MITEIVEAKNGKPQYQDVIYDSKEEVHMVWYFEELEQNGWIERVEYHPKTHTLLEPVFYTWKEELKTKTKARTNLLLEGCSYTYDFHWLWKDHARDVFYQNINSGQKLHCFFRAFRDVTCIDVKGTWKGRSTDYQAFLVKQKWLWKAEDIFVQPTVPEILFAKTFTPARYLKCDKDIKRDRTIKFETKSLWEFTS